MSESLKNILKRILKLMPIIVVVIVCITFYMIFDINRKVEEINYNTDNILEVNTDAIDENKTTENTNIENTLEEDSSPVAKDEFAEGTTDKKQQAIDLVKEKWGEDSTVSFRCDSVNSSGEYIIAVISKSSATVKNYFKVNLKDKTVELEY